MSADRPNHPIAADDSEGSSFAERLAFLQLQEADAQRLRSLSSRFASWADEFVTAFYAHLFRFDETARFLRDPALVERLKQSQREHFASMLAAKWDEDYEKQRRHVGQVHADIGINPEIFLGAYNQYLQFLLSQLANDLPAEHRDALTNFQVVIKAVLLDIGLSLDAYFRQSTHRLRSALDMLWRANFELRHFAQFTSHDLKTPLATMANLCDEALDEFGPQLPEEARHLIQSARSRAFRMSTMIDELLDSAVNSASADANSNISVQAALSEAIERLKPRLTERKIEVRVVGELPRVWGNTIRLREAFYNLLSNATKFIDTQPGLIEIAAENQEGRWLISVTDNGPGIPGDERLRVFAPFRRLPMHRHLPGSGLGLYFTKNLIELQEGRIWVENAPERGARFVISLAEPHNE